MSKRKRNESSRDDGTYAAKKKGKFNIFAFILCLLIAFVIWLYASTIEDDKKAENTESKNSTEVTVEANNG